MFAISAKGVYFYVNQYPGKEDLLSVHGIVRDVSLGGDGRSTSMQIESEYGLHRYSSYYGKVWPGMDHIQTGDHVFLLAERNRLNKNEIFEGKRYYIWELIHQNQIIVNYEDMRVMVEGKEAIVNRYINICLVVSSILLAITWIRKIILGMKR